MTICRKLIPYHCRKVFIDCSYLLYLMFTCSIYEWNLSFKLPHLLTNSIMFSAVHANPMHNFNAHSSHFFANFAMMYFIGHKKWRRLIYPINAILTRKIDLLLRIYLSQEAKQEMNVWRSYSNLKDLKLVKSWKIHNLHSNLGKTFFLYLQNDGGKSFLFFLFKYVLQENSFFKKIKNEGKNDDTRLPRYDLRLLKIGSF